MVPLDQASKLTISSHFYVPWLQSEVPEWLELAPHSFTSLSFSVPYTFSTPLWNRDLNHNFPKARESLSHYQIGLQCSFVWFRDCFAIQTRLQCPGRQSLAQSRTCQLPGALATQLVSMFLLWLRRICQSFWNPLPLHQMCYSVGKFTPEKPLRKNTDVTKALLHPLTSHFFLISLVTFSGNRILCTHSWGSLALTKTFNDPEFLMLTLNQILQMLLISCLIFSWCCSLQTGQVFPLVLRRRLSDFQVKLLKKKP